MGFPQVDKGHYGFKYIRIVHITYFFMFQEKDWEDMRRMPEHPTLLKVQNSKTLSIAVVLCAEYSFVVQKY